VRPDLICVSFDELSDLLADPAIGRPPQHRRLSPPPIHDGRRVAPQLEFEANDLHFQVR
jgi:hypothetical protein